jgi:hypothetical protein
MGANRNGKSDRMRGDKGIIHAVGGLALATMTAVEGRAIVPLHDWSDDRAWESVHLLWLNQLLE